MPPKKTRKQASLPKNRPQLSKKLEKPTKTAHSSPFLYWNQQWNALSYRFKFGTSVLFFFFCWWFWGVRYADYLYVSQNSDLFLYDNYYFWSSFSEIGGFLCYTTSFIVQFFHEPWQGGLILALLLLGIQLATARTFSLSTFSWLLSFVPPLIISSGVIWARYYIYNILTINILFNIFPGTFLALLFPLFYRSGKTFFQRLLLLSVTLTIFFPLIGFYSLLGCLFCLGQEALLCEQAKRKVHLEYILLVVLILPFCWYWPYCETIPFRLLYIKGFLPRQIATGDYFQTIFPYPLALALFYLFYAGMIIHQVLRGKNKIADSSGQTEPLEKHNAPDETNIVTPSNENVPETEEIVNTQSPLPGKSKSKSETGDRFATSVFALMLLLTFFCTYREGSFFSTLALQRALDEENWDRAIMLDQTCTQPVRPTIMVRNLALFEKGRLAEEAFQWTQVGRVIPILVSVSTYRVYGEMVLYRYGLLNYAAKSATNKMVSIPESAGVTRIFVRIALVQNRCEIARRYIERLEKTRVHKSWVRKYRDWLDDHDRKAGLFVAHPERINPANVETVQKEIDLITSRAPADNYFTDVKLPEFCVMELGQHKGFEQATYQMQELTLIGSMLTCSQTSFMKNIDKFAKILGDRPMPRYIQEGYLYYTFMSTRKIGPPIHAWDPVILARFRRYLDLSTRQQASQNNLQWAQQKAEFADTFWWYANDQPETYFY